MIINDERKLKTVSFDTIREGEIFTDADGDFMMRTEEICGASGEEYNAVNLESGDMYTFKGCHEVIRINRANITIYD
jgi:hypothetical protein